MDYAALKSYIVADAELAALAGPAGAKGDYPESQDETIAKAINARTAASSKKLPAIEAYLYLLKNLKWRGIETAAAATSPVNDQAYVAVKLFTTPGVQLDFTSAEFVKILDALITSKLIVAANKTDLAAMSTVTVSMGEKQFGQRVSNMDVAQGFGRNGFGG